VRNVFHQYQQPENRLTHALVCALAEDSHLLKRFIRWATGRAAPKGKLEIVEQQRPGEEARNEDEAAGIPDAWIFNDDGWALLLESKITAHLGTGQLLRHLATAARRGFPNATLLVVTARDQTPGIKGDVIALPWMAVYGWLLRERRRSEWAARCANYMEILESDLIEQGKLKEGAVTTFSGIPFDSGNPYSYLEAKRLLKLALEELRNNRKLVRILGMDPKSAGRGAITGRESDSVWDYLSLRQGRGDETFTHYPHLTLAIKADMLLVIVTVPHGIKPEFRRRLVDLEAEGFRELFGEICRRICLALRKDKGAVPWAEVLQRRYLSQRSIPIVDAKVEFDLRTAVQKVPGRGRKTIRVQPQWLDAAYRALARKQSNLQLVVGAAFPYGRSSSVSQRAVLSNIAETWLACRPLLTAMGIK
jgi:hypothetical protein